MIRVLKFSVLKSVLYMVVALFYFMSLSYAQETSQGEVQELAQESLVQKTLDDSPVPNLKPSDEEIKNQEDKIAKASRDKISGVS